MNAVSLKPETSVAETVDKLIANHGLWAVLLTVGTRLLKRSRPPDTVADLAVRGLPELDLMDDRLRADIGLDPKPEKAPHVLLGVATHRPAHWPFP
jgi:hypothetical protein